METFINIGVGVIIVGLVGYIWSSAMTPAKCMLAHKVIVDEIRNEFAKQRMEMKEIVELVVENKILKELRKMNGGHHGE